MILDSEVLAGMLRYEWGLDAHAPVNIRSFAFNINNLTVFWFPMGDEISGCCCKTDEDNVIFINTDKSLGRQNFTLAHEIYHLLYENSGDFIVCGFNNHTQSEIEADEFAAHLLMPNSAMFWFRNYHKLENWTLEDIIRCEQYFQVSHLSMLYRLYNLGWINKDEFLSFRDGIIQEASKMGFDTLLYKPSSKDEKYNSAGELIQLTERMFDKNRISRGKRKEILQKSFRNDMIYNLERAVD